MISKELFFHYLHNHMYDEIRNFKVDNAIILAAGKSNRFKPFSLYKPKGLCRIKNEVLIERQIKQLKEVGINDIFVIVGYKKELFSYLADKFNVRIIENNEYDKQDNLASLELVAPYLKNSYICSVDNYYKENIFNLYNYRGYYSSVFNEGETNEWCITTDENEIITNVTIGGINSDVMMGCVYFDNTFSKRFVHLMQTIDFDSIYRHKVWEYLYINNLDTLKLEKKVYANNIILEFDTMKDAFLFDGMFYENNKM